MSKVETVSIGALRKRIKELESLDHVSLLLENADTMRLAHEHIVMLNERIQKLEALKAKADEILSDPWFHDIVPVREYHEAARELDV